MMRHSSQLTTLPNQSCPVAMAAAFVTTNRNKISGNQKLKGNNTFDGSSSSFLSA